MSNGTLAEVAAWMKLQVGYHEGSGNSNKYSRYMGHPSEPWCADFVNAGLKSNGVPLVSTTAYTPALAEAYQRAHRWTTHAQVGAIGFVYSASTGRIDHAFWVRAVSGGTEYSIEGNYSNQVMRVTRPALRSPGHSGVIGYGLPAYKPVASVPHPPPPPPHPIAVGEVEMFIVGRKDEAEEYISDSQTRRWIPDAAHRDILVKMGAKVYRIFTTDAGMNMVAGPLAGAESPAKVARQKAGHP